MVTAAAPLLARDDLRGQLHDGWRRARLYGAPVLVSVSTPLPALDPLDLFVRAGALAYDRLYWERPADGVAVAGVGVAHAIETTGAAEAGRAWRAFLEDALIHDSHGGAMAGPLLMGGFAFAGPVSAGKERAHGAPWEGFPAGRLTLPRLSLATTGGASTMTVNSVLTATSNVETETARLLRWYESILPQLAHHADMEARSFLSLRASASACCTSRPEAVQVDDVLPRAEWEAIVDDAVQACRSGALEKVVLARAVRARAQGSFDPAMALGRLRDAYPSAYVFAVARGARCFLGATPERLVRLCGGVVDAACLAGSAPRGATPEDDARLGTALLASVKDRAEHAVVVREVRAALEGLCREVHTADVPRLLRLCNVQHLYTPVDARVAARACVLDLVQALHPTPAVGGYPCAAALRFIHERERLDRGWYAGPVGWLDRRGEGEFAVALRSALVHGVEATLFAGCGIVAQSRPADEYAETCLKLRPMLAALGA